MSTLTRARYRFAVFATFLLAAGFLVYGAQKALESNTNDVLDWLPAGFEETRNLQEFGRHFGAEEFLMVSWPGCTLDDPRLTRLAAELRQPADASGGVRFFADVHTAREAYEQLLAPPLELSPAQAIRRLEGLLVGPGGRPASLVMTVAEHVDRSEAVAFVYRCVDRVPGLSRDAVHMAGTTIDGVAIDEASQSSLLPMTLLSFATCVGLMYAVFRCWSTTLMVFVVAIFNQQATLAVIYYSGWHLDSVLLMAPTLVFVISISGGVHLMNYYREAVRHGGLPGAPMRALRHGWVPCLLSAGTTSLGIASLMASHLVPIQKFGVYASSMVLAGIGVLFLLLPALLEQWPSRSWSERLRSIKADDGWSDRMWHALSSSVARFYLPLIVLAVAGVLAGSWGVTKTQATARLHDMFSPQARVVQDYNWLEQHIGPLVPIEVVVKLPPLPTNAESYATPMLERLQLIRRIEAAVRKTEGIDAVASALTFAPSVPRSRLTGFRPAERARRIAMDRQLSKNLKYFVDLQYLSVKPADEHWWRVSGRVAASSRHDYREVLGDVRRRVTEVLQTQNQFADASAVLSGAIPLVQKAQEQMLLDLLHSFITAFLVIAAAVILMMWGWSMPELAAARTTGQRIRILQRGAAAGLVVMLPNIFPCVVVFGAMGLLGLQIEVGTVMTATVAMGIAVDDTVHYITWFRRSVAEGLSQGEAVERAYRRCGTAMAQTSLIVGVGLLVYVFSAFGPIQRFAWLMFATLMVALLADLAITPSLLHSRLGRLFLPAPDSEAVQK